MASINATFEVPFGILNKKGSIKVQNRTCINPIFAHETYPITCTFDNKYNIFHKEPEVEQTNLEDNNRKFGKLYYYVKDSEEAKVFEGQSYQKLYRKNVRWDFGDGTEIDGYSATHTYKTPGKYTITCTFFDIDRKGIVNGYSIDVIVKQIIPTELKFDLKESSKEAIHCSAVEKIARLETLLSNNVTNDIPVIAKRIYQKDEIEDTHWNEVKELPYPHLRRYYTFLESKKIYYYNSSRLYKEELTPVSKYTPEYETIYGTFTIEDDIIVFTPYRIKAYKQAEAMPPLSILDPNSDITETETYIECPVKDVSSINELPEDTILIGKRAWIDVYYKNDFISDKNVISFFFDLDEINLHNSIKSSANFLNIPPLGLSIEVMKNDINDIDFSVTLNGFITSFDEVDKLVQLSLIKNYSFPAILIPYVRAQDKHFITEVCEIPILQEDELLTLNEYNPRDYMVTDWYIPKDFDFDKYRIQLFYNKENNSEISIERYENDPYLRAVKFNLKSILSGEINIEKARIIFDYPLCDLDSVIIPTEKYYNEDVDKLIEIYTPHKMFDNKVNLRGFLSNTFKTNNLLNYIITKGIHFFDDNIHIKTNYVDKLVQSLTMMGQDVSEYSSTNFEGVNELKDLCRILSMNHPEIVGNLVDEEYDIKVAAGYKGRSIGERLLVTDKIYVLMENKIVGENRYSKGKITKIERDGEIYQTIQPTEIVIIDDYANTSRIASFAGIEPSEITESGEGIYCIEDYNNKWNWNLLLPGNYRQEDKANIINSYYSFHLLVPPIKKKRIGNFADENTVTEEITDPEKWVEEDGITFRMLQKVIHGKI